jgi:hypothetical protein
MRDGARITGAQRAGRQVWRERQDALRRAANRRKQAEDEESKHFGLDLLSYPKYIPLAFKSARL